MLDSTKVVYGISRINRADYDPTGALDVPSPADAPFADPNGEGPGGPWTELGLTQDYLTFRANTDYAEIPADQVPDPVARVLESRDVGLTGNLMQITPQNLNWALGFGQTHTQSASAGVMGYDRFTLTEDVTEELAAILVDFQTPGNGQFGRMFFPKVRPAASVETTFGNRTEATLIPFDFAAVPHDQMDPITIMDMYMYTPALSSGDDDVTPGDDDDVG
jgi:hypothetical protein